jgi:hypothetical protein
MEVDNGICLVYSEYEFSEKGLAKAKTHARGLRASLYRSVKIYSPDESVVFELGKKG